MTNKYDECVNEWDKIFSNESSKIPESKGTGNEVLDKGLDWVCEDTKSILDFGCGNGSMLFLCALKGTKYNTGIDLSEEGIKSAKISANKMSIGEYNFIQGSIDTLKNIAECSFDAVILSNIIDNLYPEDSKALINEVHRILKNNGKLLVQLNPYITVEKMKKDNIKVIKDNLLDDGLLLLNNTTEEWESFFEVKFNIKEYDEIYYPQYEQTNRMFCLTKKC